MTSIKVWKCFCQQLLIPISMLFIQLSHQVISLHTYNTNRERLLTKGIFHLQISTRISSDPRMDKIMEYKGNQSIKASSKISLLITEFLLRMK
jgi:hypothetical protein